MIYDKGILFSTMTGLGLSLAATGAAADKPLRQAQDRLNVLFILADDLGWRDTAVYGSTYYKTPNIDALAKSGMRFTDAYSANPLCSATRSSIMTGQYPLRNGFTGAGGHVPALGEHKEKTAAPPEIRGAGPSSKNYLDPKFYTLGKAMKDADYATAFFGKWHMGHQKKFYPENHGFDYVKGGRHHPGPPGKDPKRKFYPPWNCDTLKDKVPPDTHVDDHLANLAIDYMKKQKQAGKPFFACYWAYSVHAPFQSKPELMKKWKDRKDPNGVQRSPTMGAMIEVLDANVGRLMKALEENGLADNTIVIFTSDNGGNMYNTVDGTTPTNNAPLKIGKGNNYEGGVRIPLIIRWPGVTKPDSVNGSVVSTVDHYPALLQMTGQNLRPADHKDGVSYVPALQGKPFDRGPTICDFPHPVWATYNVPNTSIRMGDWKLYRFWHDSGNDLKHRYELYNLKDDIGETKDLATAQPEQLKKMAETLDAYYKESGVPSYNANKNYNNCTVGTWFAETDDGKLSAKDGGLVIDAAKPGFTVKNRFFPPGGKDGLIIFEARSADGVALEFVGNKKSKVVQTTESWKTYQLSGKAVAIERNRFALTLKKKGRVELRNVRVTAADKTEMMRFKFY